MEVTLLTKEKVLKRIREVGVIPAIHAATAEEAMFAAEHVLAGGISIVEIASTIPASEQLVRDLTRRFPTLIVGSDIVDGIDDARRQLEAGAAFLTSPGLDTELVRYCAEHGAAVLPGALTPTEVMLAHKAGADLVKVFPCAQVGGEHYIRVLKGRLPHIPLVAAGGVTQTAAPRFITAGASALGVGGELIPPQALRAKDGAWIRELASRFVNFVQQARAEMNA